MKESKVPRVLKEMRGNMYQQKLADKVHVSRETISKYENGRSKIPKDVSHILSKTFDNPKFALIVQNEYTGTGPVWLDGPNVDLHPAAVKEKSIEEAREYLESVQNTCFAKPLKNHESYEKEKTKKSVMEAMELMTSLAMYTSITCLEAGFSCTELWKEHYRELKSKGYLMAGGPQ